MRRLKFLFLVWCLAYPHIAVATCMPGSQSDVLAAIQRRNADDVEAEVKIDKVCGGYAKAFVTHKTEDGPVGRDTVFLKKTEDKWVIVDEGRNLDPARLELPEDVW